VFAALAVGRFIEDSTGWSIQKFVRTARRYCTVRVRVGEHHLLTAEDPTPDDLRGEQAGRIASARILVHERCHCLERLSTVDAMLRREHQWQRSLATDVVRASLPTPDEACQIRSGSCPR
jgi:ABC-type thiamine transport system ATPase subunit